MNFLKTPKILLFHFYRQSVEKFQRLEFETDLIGCHLKKFQSILRLNFRLKKDACLLSFKLKIFLNYRNLIKISMSRFVLQI